MSIYMIGFYYSFYFVLYHHFFLCVYLNNLYSKQKKPKNKIQKTYELEALLYRLKQINAEDQEKNFAFDENNTGKLIAKVNIENIPPVTTVPTKPIDHNRLSTSQLYGKQGCVVLAEESSSRR